MRSPAVSLVIRSYNEEMHIDRLLRGISEQSIERCEIILIDSGSTDATLSIAAEYPVKILTLAPESFSFGRSLNVGCQAANGDIIVIASAHVYPLYHDWLEQLVKPFGDPKVALVYGKQRGDEYTKYSENQVFARWFPDESKLVQHHPFCNNANAAIRRELWQSEPYNEELTGLEDLDWAKKLIANGYYLAYVPEAEVIHVHDETPVQTFNRYRREAIALKAIYPEEQFHIHKFFHLWVANVLTDWSHALADGVLHRQWRQIIRFRLMQFWGTYRGYRQHGRVSKKLYQTFYYPNGHSSQTKPRNDKRSDLRIRYDLPIRKDEPIEW